LDDALWVAALYLRLCVGGTIDKWLGKEIKTGICLVTANNEEKAEGRRFISIKNSHFLLRKVSLFLRWNPKSSLTVPCPNLSFQIQLFWLFSIHFSCFDSDCTSVHNTPIAPIFIGR
jgi:hypothetical protein